MVQKTKKQQGFLFDDTPRGLLEALLGVGVLTLTLSVSPELIVLLGAIGYAVNTMDKGRRNKLNVAAHYLKQKKYLSILPASKNRVRIFLTEMGQKRALDVRAKRLLSIPIERPLVWDKKWRLILFDIAADERVKRNAFRSFIRRIGAVQLQKSVWLHPFDCSEQVKILRDFFNLSDEELTLVVANTIGSDHKFRKHFRL